MIVYKRLSFAQKENVIKMITFLKLFSFTDREIQEKLNFSKTARHPDQTGNGKFKTCKASYILNNFKKNMANDSYHDCHDYVSAGGNIGAGMLLLAKEDDNVAELFCCLNSSCIPVKVLS